MNIVLELQQLTYRILHEPNEAIAQLLAETVYGSKGLRYRHARVQQQVKDLIDPDFHTLWLDSELVAVAAYCKRDLKGREDQIDAYYIRYFSVKSEYRGHGIGKHLTTCLEQHYRSNCSSPTVFYAYIEPKNLPSLGVSSHFKQEQLGTFKTSIISDPFPKKHPLFTSLEPNVHRTLFQTDEKQHQAFFHTNKIGYKDGSYALVKDDEILAVVQAHVVEWDIVDLPGTMGWLSRNVLHFLPIIGRFAPRNSFKFIAFEGLYLPVENKDLLLPLLHSCLQVLNQHIGMIYLDVKDPHYKWLQEEKLGLMSKIQHPPAVAFLANFVNVPEEEQQHFKSSIKYISAFDLT